MFCILYKNKIDNICVVEAEKNIVPEEVPLPEHPELVVFASYSGPPKFPVRVSVLADMVRLLLNFQKFIARLSLYMTLFYSLFTKGTFFSTVNITMLRQSTA